MKFTYTHKKWAMTGLLLAVLGFNVSMNQHSGGVASIDMASESADVADGKLITGDGVSPVKFIASGDQVLAIVGKNVEGKICYTCGTTYTLDATLDKNKSNIDELTSKLMKQIEVADAPDRSTRRQGTDRKIINGDRGQRPDVIVDDVPDENSNDRVSALSDKCEKGHDQVNCLSRGLVCIIKNHDKSENDAIVRVVDKKLIPAISTNIVKLRDDAYASNDFSTLKSDTQDALAPLADIAKAARKDESLSSKLVKVQAGLLVKEYQRINELDKEARQTAGTDQATSNLYSSESRDRKMNSLSIKQDLIDAQVVPSIQALQQQLQETNDRQERLWIAQQMQIANNYSSLLDASINQVYLKYFANGTTTMSTNGVITPPTAGATSTGPLAPGALPAPPTGAPTQGFVPAGNSQAQVIQAPADAINQRGLTAPRGFPN